MSSLGDLLLGKTAVERSNSPPSVNEDRNREEKFKNEQENDVKPCRSPSFYESDHPNDQHQFSSQKVFPDRIEKSNVKVEECQSNASSTDDYVRELLDPNDRPRNVWHVVEGPKNSPTDFEDRNDTHDRRHNYDDVDYHHSRKHSDADSSSPSSDRNYRGRETQPEEARKRAKLESAEDDVDNNETVSDKRVKSESTEDDAANNLNFSATYQDKSPQQNLTDEAEKHKSNKQETESLKSSSRSKSRHEDLDKGRSRRQDSRERSTSSRRHHRDRHHDRNRERHRDRSRDRHADHDRRRSPGRHSKSRRRRDYSDDDDDDEIHRRHRGSRSRHHDRRSHSRSYSRSRSRSLSRRRRRSKSNSQSPITKRNSRTILIMQLSPRVVSRDLEKFFSDIGPVREVRLIMDSKTKRHKGIAYIEFEDEASATAALTLNGQKFHGVPMQIQSALLDRVKGGDWQHASSSSHHHYHQQQHSHHHHSSNHSSSTSHPSSRSTLLPPNSYRVYIGGLHVGITEDMLRTIVEPFGLIVKIELIKDRNTGVSRGYAFVTFANIEDGLEAIRNLNEFELAGKNLRVSKSTDKSDH